MKPEWKKLLVLNLPYLLFVYLFAKCGQAYRLAAGVDASAKLLHLTNGISVAFARVKNTALPGGAPPRILPPTSTPSLKTTSC